MHSHSGSCQSFQEYSAHKTQYCHSIIYLISCPTLTQYCHSHTLCKGFFYNYRLSIVFKANLYLYYFIAICLGVDFFFLGECPLPHYFFVQIFQLPLKQVEPQMSPSQVRDAIKTDFPFLSGTFPEQGGGQIDRFIFDQLSIQLNSTQLSEEL